MPPKDDRDLPQNQSPLPQGYPPPGYLGPPSQDYYAQNQYGPPPAYGYPRPPGIITLFKIAKFMTLKLIFFDCIKIKIKIIPCYNLIFENL